MVTWKFSFLQPRIDDAKISPTTRYSQTRRANIHSSFPTESYDEEQYDINTSVDTIWANGS